MKLVYASYTSTTLLSPEFFKNHVCDKAGGTIDVKKKAQDMNNKLFGFIGGSTPTPMGGGDSGENELCLDNRVLVGVIGTYLFILKEKWGAWKFVPSGEEI